MTRLKFLYGTSILIIGVFFASERGQGQIVPRHSAEAVWKEIAPFFSVPQPYEGKYGEYRSPLKFYDGQPVRTPDDWKKRREEILLKWSEIMGRWPPLMEDQKLELIESTQKDGYTLNHVRFFWMPNEETDAYLLVPDGDGKKPAVITVFYEPETAAGFGRPTPNLDFALQLAKRGFVTLSIGTTETTKAKTYSLYYPSIENATVQPLSMLAYAAANAWHALSNQSEVDPDRIGIMGLSYGGKWSMFASCLFEKFACAVWSDPGIVFDETKGKGAANYWEPWYLGYYPPPWQDTWRSKGMVPGAKGAYPKLVAGGFDLHELHALMAPRPFLVSGGNIDTSERWIPLNHAIAVNKLLGYENRIAMTHRPMHLPTAEANEQAYLFFEYFLKWNGINSKQ